jgi:hypothetical protein
MCQQNGWIRRSARCPETALLRVRLVLPVVQGLRKTWLLDQDASLLAFSSSLDKATRNLYRPVSNERRQTHHFLGWT